MTLNNLYQSITNELADFVGLNEAGTMTYMLLEHFTLYDKLFVCLNPNVEVDDLIIERINRAIQALQTHKPIQYILGETSFCDLQFFVDESVLIPRPETEELVNWILEDSSQTPKILDICTGSGCIAIALAHYLKKSQVYAVDVSQGALNIARKNAISNHVDVHFLEKDILSSDFENEINTCFDIIVSNPPYVRESEKQYMHQRVLNYEPNLALFVEDDNPLLFYHRILKMGQSLLNNNGKIFFEINEAFGEEIVMLFSQYRYTDVVLRKDIHGKNRMISGKLLVIND
jgi:release factor glutamine methyltransferase